LQNICGSVPPASANLCDTCISDAQCEPGQLCIYQSFPGETIGPFCFPQEAQTVGCSQPPYGFPQNATSIDGVNAVLCTLRTTSCLGLASYQTRSCTSDADCGADFIDDGICDPALSVCTYACVSSIDCPGVPCTNSRCEL
jgi:hypothetical protein